VISALETPNNPGVFMAIKPTVSVIFTYDENCRKWDVVVSGVKDTTEALQAFNAVAITCKDHCTVYPVSIIEEESIHHQFVESIPNMIEMQCENNMYKLTILDTLRGLLSK
jgi:hypothetical protein